MHTDTAPGMQTPVTPFEEVFSTGLLRLRRYGSTATPSGPPLLLVYSLVKQSPVIAYLTGAYHNLPAWFVAARLNERVPHRGHVPHFLADELDEPELLEWKASISPLMDPFEAWVRSDVPLAGRLVRELASPPPGPYEEGPLRIGSRRVDLDAIRCPILTVAGERDRVAPPSGSRTLLERVDRALHLTFPTGHIGLFVSLAAHERLWPRISDWLCSTLAEPAHHSA
jgi:pimeloyl-ACP methyl ester carboxylesterase